MDPRDPRAPGNDPPPPLRPPEPELTERFGPPAPAPKWEKPPRPPFDRERFLLFCVAWIIGVQYAVFILAAGSCAYLTSIIVKTKLGPSVPWTPGAGLPYCGKLPDDMKASAGESLAVLLALLGGGTIAVAEYQRRQNDNDPRNPRP